MSNNENLQFPHKDIWAYQIRKWSKITEDKCTPEHTLLTHIIAQAISDARHRGESGMKQFSEKCGTFFQGFIPEYCKILGIDIYFIAERVKEAWEKTKGKKMIDLQHLRIYAACCKADDGDCQLTCDIVLQLLDMLEAAQRDAKRWHYVRDNCDMSLADNNSYVWFVTDSGHRINVNTWAASENERAIDAAMEAKND